MGSRSCSFQIMEKFCIYSHFISCWSDVCNMTNLLLPVLV